MKTEEDYSVRLEWYEVSVAIHVAGLRQSMCIRDKRKDRPSFDGRDMQENFFGVMGEMAVAKFKGMYFPGTVDTFKDADLGKNIQVRTVGSNRNRSLIVRPADSSSDVFVLVEITKKEGFYEGVIHGWIWGRQAKRDDWLSHFGQPHKPPAYKVPTEALNKPNLSEINN